MLRELSWDPAKSLWEADVIKYMFGFSFKRAQVPELTTLLRLGFR